jgi:tetratricopeptide (TPR) repeat protein
LASAGGTQLDRQESADYDKVITAFQNRRLDEALEILLRLTKSSPQNPVFWQKLGGVYAILHKDDLALRAFETAVRLNPDDAVALGGLASCYGSLGRNADAIALYNKILKMDDDEAEHLGAYLGLYDIYMNMGRYDEAVTVVRKAVDLDPTFPFSQWGLGLAYLKAGRREEALRVYEVLKSVDYMDLNLTRDLKEQIDAATSPSGKKVK